jgi:hypothetical protein
MGTGLLGEKWKINAVAYTQQKEVNTDNICESKWKLIKKICTYSLLNRLIHRERRREEQFSLLGCKSIWSVESQPTFRKNISPLSSGSKKKRRLIFSGLHGVISQKIEVFINIIMRTSNVTIHVEMSKGDR